MTLLLDLLVAALTAATITALGIAAVVARRCLP
jgi:hypothetical protein